MSRYNHNYLYSYLFSSSNNFIPLWLDNDKILKSPHPHFILGEPQFGTSKKTNISYTSRDLGMGKLQREDHELALNMKTELRNNIVSVNHVHVEIPKHSEKGFSTITEEKHIDESPPQKNKTLNKEGVKFTEEHKQDL
jgi:hypothetical protein